MAGHFVPVYLFGQFCQRYPPKTDFIMLLDHENLGIDTSYEHIFNNDRYMIQNIIFGNDGAFCPGLPFSNHFDKGTPSRFLTEMFIFVL